jgi:hypothetical protein
MGTRARGLAESPAHAVERGISVCRGRDASRDHAGRGTRPHAGDPGFQGRAGPTGRNLPISGSRRSAVGRGHKAAVYLWRANLRGLLAGGEPSPIPAPWPAAHRRLRAWGGSPSTARCVLPPRGYGSPRVSIAPPWRSGYSHPCDGRGDPDGRDSRVLRLAVDMTLAKRHDDDRRRDGTPAWPRGGLQRVLVSAPPVPCVP